MELSRGLRLWLLEVLMVGDHSCGRVKCITGLVLEVLVILVRLQMMMVLMVVLLLVVMQLLLLLLLLLSLLLRLLLRPLLLVKLLVTNLLAMLTPLVMVGDHLIDTRLPAWVRLRG